MPARLVWNQQRSRAAGAEVVGTVLTRDVDYIKALGPDRVIDVKTARFEERCEGRRRRH